jgi:hypothetical protein
MLHDVLCRCVLSELAYDTRHLANWGSVAKWGNVALHVVFGLPGKLALSLGPLRPILVGSLRTEEASQSIANECKHIKM